MLDDRSGLRLVTAAATTEDYTLALHDALAVTTTGFRHHKPALTTGTTTGSTKHKSDHTSHTTTGSTTVFTHHKTDPTPVSAISTEINPSDLQPAPTLGFPTPLSRTQPSSH